VSKKQLAAQMQREKHSNQQAGRLLMYIGHFGQYDAVVISEIPDTESAFRLLLSLGMQGNIRTTTLQGLPR